ncbi:lipopolysaccharide biosynthesis protein [Arcticibacter sp.]|uniref:lipopolysaccharide biosynthesis protein n=1 Tax=Arcticibacter sp. TaxID=1872630 RepID=UPI003890C46D
MSLKDLLFKIGVWYKYLLSQWIVIFAIGLLGGLIGMMYAYTKKTVYTATTTFVLEDSESSGGLSQYAGLASMAGIDLGTGGGGVFKGDNILELYKSRTMIEKALLTTVEYGGKRQRLVERYIDFNRLRERWNNPPELKRVQFSSDDDQYDSQSSIRLRDSVLSVIVKDIRNNYLKVVKPDKKLSIIKADVVSPDEFFSKTFNEQIVKNVNDFYVQTRIQKSSHNVSILQQKADSIRALMNSDIYRAVEIADATPNLNPTRQTQRLAPVQRSQFSAETNKAILAELVKNLEMSKIGLRKETPLVQIIDYPVFPLDSEHPSYLKSVLIVGMLFMFLTMIVLLMKKIFSDIYISRDVVK